MFPGDGFVLVENLFVVSKLKGTSAMLCFSLGLGHSPDSLVGIPEAVVEF